VTTLMPGTACLNCRGRISSIQISAEAKRAVNPDEALELEEEGYIPELDAPAPAVIPFTTATAAVAVTEFLHRLTGFLGEERETSEVLLLIDETRIRRNHMLPQDNCFCGDRMYWANPVARCAHPPPPASSSPRSPELHRRPESANNNSAKQKWRRRPAAAEAARAGRSARRSRGRCGGSASRARVWAANKVNSATPRSRVSKVTLPGTSSCAR